MQELCNKCKSERSGTERQCSKCGATFRRERWPLFAWLALIAMPGTVFFLDGRINELMDIRVFFWYVLPITLATAILYDDHPKRSSIYFWGGAAVIISSVFLLQ